MATVHVKSKKQLADTILEKYAASALVKTQQIIYDAIQDSIREYYHEFSPIQYSRSYNFLNSLVKTDVVRTGNTIHCEVKIDEKYLDYEYPDNGGITATGRDVVEWANREDSIYGNHGGTVDAGREGGFWDIAINETIGGKTGIIAILKENLKKRGLDIK